MQIGNLLDDVMQAEEMIGRTCLCKVNNQLNDLQTYFTIRLRIQSTDMWKNYHFYQIILNNITYLTY